jgi:predicted metal-dependent hydrolase
MHHGRSTETILHIHGHPVRVVKKRMKTLRLRLIPPHGEIRVSAPHWYSDARVSQFLHSRWDWVEKQRRTITTAHPMTGQDYSYGNTILFFGEKLELASRSGGRAGAVLENGRLLLRESTSLPSTAVERQKAVENWYRKELKAAALPLMESWASRMKVHPKELRIRKMSTRWGTCNTGARRIWLSLELALLKPEILEFVLVHELAHLLEPTHNRRFYNIMDMYLPSWRQMDRFLKGRGEI